MLANFKRRDALRKMIIVSGAIAGLQLFKSTAVAQEASPALLLSATECALVKVETQISSNHGHEILVSLFDALVGDEKVYSIQGKSGHEHLVSIKSLASDHCAGDFRLTGKIE